MRTTRNRADRAARGMLNRCSSIQLLRPECSRRKRVRGLRRGEHLRRAVADAGQFDQAPVEGPAARLRQLSRSVEHIHAALMTRGPPGARLRTLVAVIARISFAEIDGERQFEVAPQLRLA